MPAQGELDLDSFGDNQQPQLLEARDLASRKVFVGKVGEGRAAPEALGRVLQPRRLVEQAAVDGASASFQQCL